MPITDYKIKISRIKSNHKNVSRLNSMLKKKKNNNNNNNNNNKNNKIK